MTRRVHPLINASPRTRSLMFPFRRIFRPRNHQQPPILKALFSSTSSLTMPPKRKSEATVAAPTKKKIQSTTTKASVSNFFTPTSQKEPEKTTWRLVAKTLLVGTYTNKAVPADAAADSKTKTKIAGFDLDSTLITTKSGNKFAKTSDDWQWWSSSVPSRLKALHSANTHHIVLFTNQAGIPDPTKESARLTTFKEKVAAIFNALDIPDIVVYAATANDKYRKPRPGMWDECLDDLDLDVGGTLEVGESYLIGDAAGREGDFSDTDRNWALNIGMGFRTPEEFFLDEAPKPMSHKFDPSKYTLSPAAAAATFTLSTAPQELLLFVGSPGAGKSTFYFRHLRPLGYMRVNQDILKTKPKCFSTATTWLKEGKNIVIDNTNADRATRAAWVALAKAAKVPVRCVYFTSSEELCMHNAAVRAFGGTVVNPEGREMLPGIAFRGFKGRFEEPAEEEGFVGVVRVEFRWEGEEEERKIWSRFWT